MTGTAEASYSYFIGKDLTGTGVTYLGGWGDEPSGHWIEITPRTQHPPGATMLVGATSEADMPGELMPIPQVAETARWIGAFYTQFAGFPSPLTNGGLNEYQVAVRDVFSLCRDEFKQWIPPVQRGPQYSDLARIVLERAKSAREGARLIGELIEKYGYTTYGGNSHMIADPDEGWIVIECPAKGIWAAARLGPKEVRVSRPGYIQEIPENYRTHPDFMGSPNLISFAIEQGWYDPKAGKPFSFQEAYSKEPGTRDSVRRVEDELRKRSQKAGKITMADAVWATRLLEFSGDASGYGQIVPLMRRKHPELGMIWFSNSAALTTPLVPIFLAAKHVPPEFEKHRYLTGSESDRFYLYDPTDNTIAHRRPSSEVPRGVESTKSSVSIFKRLLYLTQEHFEEFYPEVLKTISAFEEQEFGLVREFEQAATVLIEQGRRESAAELLTYFVNNEMNASLRLAEDLSTSLEARTKLLHGIRRTLGPNPPPIVNDVVKRLEERGDIAL